MSKTKLKCPKSGCNHYVSTESAKDAVEDLRLHLKEVHDEDFIPDRIKERVDADVKDDRRALD